MAVALVTQVHQQVHDAISPSNVRTPDANFNPEDASESTRSAQVLKKSALAVESSGELLSFEYLEKILNQVFFFFFRHHKRS